MTFEQFHFRSILKIVLKINRNINMILKNTNNCFKQAQQPETHQGQISIVNNIHHVAHAECCSI